MFFLSTGRSSGSSFFALSSSSHSHSDFIWILLHLHSGVTARDFHPSSLFFRQGNAGHPGLLNCRFLVYHIRRDFCNRGLTYAHGNDAYLACVCAHDSSVHVHDNGYVPHPHPGVYGYGDRHGVYDGVREPVSHGHEYACDLPGLSGKFLQA